MITYVVEDDPTTRAVLSDELARRGHVVAAFADASQAWLACQTKLPPLMLVDWLLSETDGLELCRRVRGLPNGSSTVILVVTVRDQPGDLEAVLAAGADDYLAKPFEAATLAVRLTVAERQAEIVQARERAEAAARDQSRQEGVLLAAGTVQHYLGNQLSITLGYAELLANNPRLDASLRSLAQEALDGVLAAKATLMRLREITRVQTADELAGPPVLDLNAP